MHTDLKTTTILESGSNNMPSQTSNSTTDWRLWCRLCAKDDPQSNVSVFLKDEEQNGSNLDTTACNPSEGVDGCLAVAIEKYFWIQIKRNEELPKMLCTECFSLITSLVNFSDRVAKVQQMFSVLHNAYQATSSGIDFREIRLKYGLLDEDREHVLIQHQSPEVHYFDSKPKINELEERIYNNESLTPTLATNPLEDLPRIRIKIKKESVISEERKEEHFFNDIKDFYGETEASEACEDVAINETTQNAVICHDVHDKSINLRTRKHSRRNSVHDMSHAEPNIQKRRKSRRRKNKLSRENISEENRNAESSGIEDASISEPPETLLANEDEDNAGDENERKETKEVIYTCTECPRKFKRSQHLRQHLRRSHTKLIKSPTLQCTNCSKTFATSKQLDLHSKMHLPPEQRKVLPCPYCEKKFSSHTLVQTHIKYIHMNERPFICEECGIAVRTNAALKTHMLTHTDYAPFECEVCKKGFKNQIRLKNHMETHDPNKHICAECGLQLNSRATLNRHLLVHSDEMQHKCDYCGRAFKRAKALKNHLILHTGLKPYSCDFCDRTFANGSNCRSHKKKAHPEELAALEAAGGGKTYTRNIPKLEALKAVTKAADNLAPVVSKQSGRFAFGKKPKLSTQEEAPIPDQSINVGTENHKRYSSSPTSGLLITSVTSGEDVMKSAALHAVSLNSTLGNRSQTPPVVPVSVPNIDNIYNHIMKQATMAAHSASAGDHHDFVMQIKRPASQTSCATIENDNGSSNMPNMQQPQLHHVSMQHATASVANIPTRLYSQLMKQNMLQQDQQEQQQQSQSLQHLHHHQLNHHQHQYQLHQHQHQLHADDVAPSTHSPDSQTSSSHIPKDQSNTADPAHFYNSIRQNLQSPFI